MMVNGLLASFLVLQAATGWEDGPPLPRALTGNAVAAVERSDGTAAVYSFLGTDLSGGVERGGNWTLRWETSGFVWEELAPVPGPARLGASAVAVRGKVYLIGGHVLGADGPRETVSTVDVFDPASGTWSPGAPLPVSVADAVAGVWRDSLVYVVAGRHEGESVSFVQVYDPWADRWDQATPIPGAPVTGHAGALSRDALVFLDGARLPGGPEPGEGHGELEASAWRGDVDPAHPTTLRWSRLPQHPGAARFAAASGAAGTRVVFLGGGDRLHDARGVSPDGQPALPVWSVFAYDVGTSAWKTLPAEPSTPVMNQRALVRAAGYLVLVGGADGGTGASNRVRRISVLSLIAGG